MSEWREQIVRRLVPNTARVTAVSDADGLLRDPGVFQAIQAKGFAIVQFEDSISFRFDYESRFRSKWDAGEKSELVVVFKPGEYEFDTLPADVLANAQRLSFTLKEVFPKLSFDVVSELETVYYDALYRAHLRRRDVVARREKRHARHDDANEFDQLGKIFRRRVSSTHFSAIQFRFYLRETNPRPIQRQQSLLPPLQLHSA